MVVVVGAMVVLVVVVVLVDVVVVDVAVVVVEGVVAVDDVLDPATSSAGEQALTTRATVARRGARLRRCLRAIRPWNLRLR
jgi:hypothetical protein